MTSTSPHDAAAEGSASDGTSGPRLLPHRRIEQALVARITSGELAPGDRLPPERELMVQYRASRSAVKHAMDHLVQHGLVTIQPRQGATVKARPDRDQVAQWSGRFIRPVVPDLRRRYQVLAVTEEDAGTLIAPILRLEPGDLVYKVTRLVSSQRTPDKLEAWHFPAWQYPGLRDLDLEVPSILQVLADRFGLIPATAHQELHPRVASGEEAELLGIASGTPVMLVEQMVMAMDGGVVAYLRELYRDDRSEFVSDVELWQVPVEIG